MRKTQSVALYHVTAYRTVCGPLATLVVTLSTRNHIKPEIKVTHQCISLLSV